ncbi:MAG: hypothetical protein Q9217_003292 [Psora testacea]
MAAPTMTEEQTTFSLAGRSLKLDTASDIQQHISPLTPSSKHIAIDLSGNTLGVSASEKLASVLKSQKNLQTANLADIFTSRLLSEIPPALSSLLTALRELPNLHTVDLSDNAFGLNTVAPLVDFLSQHTPLRHLILQNNGLGPAAGAQVADALTALASRKAEARKAGHDVPDLETIICGRNRLESGSMPAWERMYRANRRVKVVKMVQNGIRQDGISLLLKEGLGACEGLEVLDLQDNTFTITGAQALAGVVGGWDKLKELGVGDCLLGAPGGILLAEALGKAGCCKGLEMFRAQYNEIDAKGVQALLAAAKGMERLRRVELNGNKFDEDDEGIEGLRLLLQEKKEKAGDDLAGEVEWGLDELSDLEEDSGGEDEGDEDEERKEEEEEQEAKREVVLKDADEEEEQTVAEKEDKEVDDLADALGKTHVT